MAISRNKGLKMGKYESLTGEQKKFILENYKKMPDRSIAKSLGIYRQVVHEYREEIISGKAKTDSYLPGSRAGVFMKKRAGIILTVLFIGILLFALNVRKHTFNLPHFRGDQHHYAGLAFKLDTQGISGYNLRGIDIHKSEISPHLFQLKAASDKGHVLKDLARANITYYDEPLHHIPFGFPMAIALSHKIFAHGEPYYLLSVPEERNIIIQAPRGVGLRDFRFAAGVKGKQYYSIIIPLLFSLLLISLVYFLAKYLYKNEIIAFTAMFLMAISPIDILTSQKIWADDMTAMLTLAALLLYVLAVGEKKPLLALAGGVLCGLATITKQNGAFIVFAIVIWHFIINADKLFKKETFIKTLFDKNLIMFGLGMILSSGYWFFKVTSIYGNPIYMPHQPDLTEVAKTGWFAFVTNRPRYLYLAGIPYQNPLFALAYLAPIWLWLDKKESKNTALLLIVMAVFIFIFSVYLGGKGKEHRYMLPSYAVFAVLAAYVADKLRVFINKKLRFNAGTFLLIITLVISAMWSIPIGLEAVFHNSALIAKPF